MNCATPVSQCSSVTGDIVLKECRDDCFFTEKLLEGTDAVCFRKSNVFESHSSKED